MTTAAAIKERPILFSAPMIRAILDGRKTMTRRVVKRINPAYLDQHCERGATDWRVNRDALCRGGLSAPLRCPYGQPGERLWVKETFQVWTQASYEYGECDIYEGALNPPHETCEHFLHPKDANLQIEYRATSESEPDHWRSPIHMPRWASRITLEITGVRVERLHEITEADAAAEGFAATHPVHGYGLLPVDAFMHLWHKINGPDSWAANPWVWVVSFKRAF